MHLHFVQSLEPLQGAGLGQAALSLHLAIARTHPLPATRDSLPSSILLSTRTADFDCTWQGVIQGVRRGPGKAFYAPELKRLAAEVIGQAEWFHGHGLYVWLNMWLGGEARRRGKPLVYHPHGFFDPWILQRSRGKKRIAHWLFEDKNIRPFCGVPLVVRTIKAAQKAKQIDRVIVTTDSEEYATICRKAGAEGKNCYEKVAKRYEIERRRLCKKVAKE